MRRIGIITSDIDKDWASRELLDAATQLAEGRVINPLNFSIKANGKPEMTLQDESMESYDAFVMRAFNRQGEIDYQYEILQLLEQSKKIIINSPASLSVAESKAQTTYCLQKAGFLTPRTIVTQDLNEAIAAIKTLESAVIKPLYGSHGIGIEHLSSDHIEEILPDFMNQYGVVYLQEFIPNNGRDIRAFVVGDDIPAAMYRIACEGQWKTNVFQGSSCELCELSPQTREVCIEATKAIGLDYTGIDIIESDDGPVILELNGAPSWFGLSAVTDENIAAHVIKHVLRILDAGQSARQPMDFKF
ncbi:MAG: RimK family alpha-L-glutamate ligase [Armatimonadota bacterium]